MLSDAGFASDAASDLSPESVPSAAGADPDEEAYLREWEEENHVAAHSPLQRQDTFTVLDSSEEEDSDDDGKEAAYVPQSRRDTDNAARKKKHSDVSLGETFKAGGLRAAMHR
jgi:hypothetical protein